MSILEYIQEGAAQWDASYEFNIDRNLYLNASTATQCIRHQWYSRHAAEPSPTTGYMRRGRMCEEYIIRCLAMKGVPMRYCGADQLSIVSDEHRISGTPDGFVFMEGHWVMIEIKSIDPRTYLDSLPKEDHKLQARVCMELAYLQEDATYPRPEYCILIYVDASNFDNIHTFFIDRKQDVLDTLKPRAETLLSTEDVKYLDREGKLNKTCNLYGGCRYAATCGVTLKHNVPYTDDSAVLEPSDVEELVREYTCCKSEVADLSKRLSRLKEELVTLCANKEGHILHTKYYAVTYKQSSGYRTYDTKRMLADGLDIQKYKKQSAPFNTLILTPVDMI